MKQIHEASPIQEATVFLKYSITIRGGKEKDHLRFLGPEMRFRSFEEFWPFYMNQHSKPSTRRWHFFGTLCSLFFLLSAIFLRWWFVFFAPLSGYGLAWYSHFFIEENIPDTFGHPVWSFMCDVKMFVLMLTGRMDKEMKRLGKRPVLQVF